MLESVEIIAMTGFTSIFFLAIIVPWWWRAGKTPELAHRDWAEKDMSVICDMVYIVFKSIEADSEKMLDEDFMMNLFSPLYTKLPELQ